MDPLTGIGAQAPEDARPCPFCGLGTMLLCVPFEHGEHAVRCNSCEARGPIAPGRDAAWHAWNHRKPPILAGAGRGG